VLTCLTQGFVDVSGEGLGRFRVLALGDIGFKGPGRYRPERVGPPDMDEEANQHESSQQELVKPQVRSHDDVPSHGSERRLFYRIGFRRNYPLSRGTRPGALEPPDSDPAQP